MENINDARITALLEAFVSLTLTLAKQNNLDLEDLYKQLDFSVAALHKGKQVLAAETLQEWSQSLKEDAGQAQFQGHLERARARRGVARPPVEVE